MTSMLAQGSPVADGTIELLLVDDRPLVQVGLSSILQRAATVTQVGSLADAFERLGTTQYDVIVVAAHLTGGGTWGRLEAAAPGSRLIALGGDRNQSSLDRHRLRWLPETAAAEQICAELADQARFRHRPTRPRRPDLTPQEERILRLIGDGLSNREIAARLGIAEKTVKNYITGLFAKIQVSRRTHAAAVAWKLGA